MLILKPLLLLISTTSALSRSAIIQKVQITTLTSQLPANPGCDPKCAIAHQYLAGEIGAELPWIWGKLSGDQLIQVVCTKDRCKECAFCGVKKVLEIGGGKGWV